MAVSPARPSFTVCSLREEISDNPGLWHDPATGVPVPEAHSYLSLFGPFLF